MNKKMSRYKGLILSCMSVLMIVVCVCSFSFESKASNVYYAAINEPCKSDTQGYLLLEMRNNSTGAYSFDIWFWDVVAYDKNTNSYASSEDVSAYMDISIGSNYVDFMPSAVPYGVYFDCSISVSYGTTCFQWWHSEYETTSQSLHYSANGYTVTGYSYYGNVNNFSTSISSNNAPNVVWADDKTIVEKISEVKTSIISLNSNITAQLNNIISKLGYTNECLDELKVLYEQLIEEQKKTNTWLEKIWDSIQEFLNPDEESKEESDKLESESNDKTDKLDDLNEQNKTDKTDIDSAANSVDENIDLDSIDNYGHVLSVITENQYILQILLLVFSVALVAYVLFGKK